MLVPAYRVAGRAISNISEFESGRLQNTIAVAEPILPYETANKKYVDDELAKIKGGTQLYYHEIEFGGYSTQYDKNFTVTVWCYTAKESEVFLVQELSSNRFRVVVTKTEDIIGKICSRKEYTALEDLMDSSYRTPENVVYREYELEIDAGSAFIEEEIIIAV